MSAGKSYIFVRLLILASAVAASSALIMTHQSEYLGWVFCATGLCLLFEALAKSNRRLSDRIRELEALNAGLEKFSAIGQLAAGVAHEINNPIGFINSNLQTLRQYVAHYTGLLGILNKLEKALKDKDQLHAAEVVASWEKVRTETNFAFIGGDVDNLLKESMEGVDKIGKIISDLRTLASPDRGKMVSVNVETLLGSMLNIVHNEIKYKAELVQDFGKVPLIVCNPQKIGQIFVNILINAAQAIEGKGRITVKTYTRDEHVCVDITDTGRGIRPENVTKIFDPLFTITFNSKLGEGTTFTVMLPMESL